ncbi:MAG: hypothetical protein WA432_01285 [Candidatus Babeliaceae bacterium]
MKCFLLTLCLIVSSGTVYEIQAGHLSTIVGYFEDALIESAKEKPFSTIAVVAVVVITAGAWFSVVGKALGKK